ncbi:MAG TPA: galactokinase [Rariglobus sp.]|jgi:galactokinase|nr:galactokinase [Rariglobus sp.]
MKQQLTALFQKTFGRAPTVIARAPGRIEFIGNHTDYNGGSVIGASVDRGVWVAVAPRADGERHFFSEFAGGLTILKPRAADKQAGAASWINYPLGVIAALPEFGLRQPEGFDYVAMSDLPTGAGLSSSAAIELASALAFLAVTGQQTDRETLVKIGKHAENHFVGVPCGILDQGVSGFGKANHLVFIDCRGPRFDTVSLPPGVHFWIFNTHTKHALVDGLYAERHHECQDAAKALGVSLLADTSSARVEEGRALLSPDLYKRAKHIVDEIARVDQMTDVLKQGDLAAAGRLLTASHRSSQMLFGNSTEELDFLVDTLASTPNVYGARLTGGGFGGAVMALTNAAFSAAQAQSIDDAYERKYGSRPDVLHMLTGDGAQLL